MSKDDGIAGTNRRRDDDLKKYIGTKLINAEPMDRFALAMGGSPNCAKKMNRAGEWE